MFLKLKYREVRGVNCELLLDSFVISHEWNIYARASTMILIDRFQKEDARIEFHVESSTPMIDNRATYPLLPPIENRNAVKVGRPIFGNVNLFD